MNNQTKFRAKRIDTGEWVEGDLVITHGGSTYWISDHNGTLIEWFNECKQVYPNTVQILTDSGEYKPIDSVKIN